MQQLREGNVTAYLQLYDKYHKLVYGWVLPFVKVPAHAEDIVQEVFLKIWAGHGRLDPSKSFPAYLYKISRNETFAFLKKISRDQKIKLQVMESLSEITESPYYRVLWDQYRQLLDSAIAQLPQQRQKVFTLCRVEGKTYEEAAKELGISRHTVKEHMTLAIKDIKTYFFRHGELSLTVLLLLHLR